jgi:hypothetical protein
VSGCYIADCFAGCGIVSNKVRLAGFQAREWELLNSPDHDLCQAAVRAPIKTDLMNGRCRGVMLAPPCSSWSVARDRTYPIRDRERPMGIPHLKEADQLKIDIGNKTMHAAVELAECAHANGVPWILENPHSSKMWQAPRMLRLRARRGVYEAVTDFCQWGKPWRKRTRFLIGNVAADDIVKLERRCHGRGQCSRTGRPHQHLEGNAPCGVRWTLLAMPYPARLAHSLASLLVSRFRTDYAQGFCKLLENYHYGIDSGVLQPHLRRSNPVVSG